VVERKDRKDHEQDNREVVDLDVHVDRHCARRCGRLRGREKVVESGIDYWRGMSAISGGHRQPGKATRSRKVVYVDAVLAVLAVLSTLS
jgi:hypothetical protein